MTLPRPSPKALFALYHLGIDEEGSYAFRNLSDIAELYGVDSKIILAWAKEAGFDPDTVGQVDFNLSRRHVDAQFANPETIQALIDETWRGYLDALKKRDPSKFFYDLDYDNL